MFHFDFFNFGKRIYAQKQWWIIIKIAGPHFYMVARPDAFMPCPILLVKQSDEDRLYQKILFKKF